MNMKRYVPSVAFVLQLLFVQLGAGQDCDSGTRILIGQVHAKEDIQQLSNWWGVCDGNPSRLIPLKLKPVPSNANFYEVDGRSNELVFWINGLKQMKEREIPIGVIRRDIWPGGQAVDYLGKQFVLSYERSIAGESLALSSEGKKQTIHLIPKNDRDDWSWSVEWSGDLDNDGQLDFLVYTDTSYRLYTSAPAEESEFVKEVAVFKRGTPL